MHRAAVALAALALAGCAGVARAPVGASRAPTLDLTSPANGPALARYAVAAPVAALHFEQELGGYRAQDWIPDRPGFRWVTEGGGERIERADGARFSAIGFRIAQRYRPLPKSYAPFSPFSDGGMLIHSGQFHACTAAPCDGEGPLAMVVHAPWRTARIGAQAPARTARFVSRGEGLNIYIGTQSPIAADGMVAIVDPGLPPALRAELAAALPRSLAYFADRYGALRITSQMFVSIDSRPRADGNRSTQGGTLPNQVFMHFDGEGARDTLATQGSDRLDWFFAHEIAHLVQQDRSGDLQGDDVAAWMHEGGADAMAALALRAQGRDVYVANRVAQAADDCAAGLAEAPLTQATARGAFDLHYACGLIAALAIDADLRSRGGDLHAFDRRFFAAVRGGAPWLPATWFAAARDAGTSPAALARLAALVGDDPAAARAALAALRPAVLG